MSAIGDSPLRLEDERFLTGRGRFHDDLVHPDQLWMRVIRSPLAHAVIRGIDTAAAVRARGVVDVITADDLPPGLRIPVRQPHPGIDFAPYLQAPLATGHVRYVGEPVAVVLATDPYLAEDAADLVSLDLEALPVSLDARTGQVLLPVSLPGVAAEVGVVVFEYGDVDEVFASAPHIVTEELSIGRHSGTPLEPRGLVAEYDSRRDRLSIWGATKVPFFNRRVMAGMLGIPEYRIHMPECDAGGSFGIRGEFYPEDLLVPFLCLRHRRPVKWSEDRAEHLVAANHAREQWHRMELALDDEGHLLGMRDEGWMDTGAYIRTHGAVVAALTASMVSGPYRLPACRSRIHIVCTNKTPVGTFRAPGRFQHNFVREHVIDLAADRLGIDPVEIRRRNLLTRPELPHRRPLHLFGASMVLDGSDHLGHFDKGRAAIGFQAWQLEASRARAAGRAVGAGCAAILEKAGLGYDSAVVDVGVTGAIRVVMGGSSSGQGIQTAMAQIAAESFDVPIDQIHVVLSDTDVISDGVGTFASRTTVVGGSAVHEASQEVLRKARRIAGLVLDRPADVMQVRGGRLVDPDQPDRSIPLGQLALMANTPMHVRPGDEPGLVGRSTFVADGMTYPYGAHFCLAEVDRETGQVQVLRYALSYEIGRSVNPRMVHGQLLGGVVQGMGGALLEEFRYDVDGSPQSLTFEEYRWPRAGGSPQIQIEVYEDSPSPGNPLGVRGAGEGGTAGVGAAVANAVRDALQLRGSVLSLPLRPEHVLELIDRAAVQ